MNSIIDSLFMPIWENISKITKNNISKFIICQLCEGIKNNDSQDFYYIIRNNSIMYFHKDCYRKYIDKHKEKENIEIVSPKKINNNEEKCISYEQKKQFSNLIKETQKKEGKN